MWKKASVCAAVFMIAGLMIAYARQRDSSCQSCARND